MEYPQDKLYDELSAMGFDFETIQAVFELSPKTLPEAVGYCIDRMNLLQSTMETSTKGRNTDPEVPQAKKHCSEFKPIRAADTELVYEHEEESDEEGADCSEKKPGDSNINPEKGCLSDTEPEDEGEQDEAPISRSPNKSPIIAKSPSNKSPLAVSPAPALSPVPRLDESHQVVKRTNILRQPYSLMLPSHAMHIIDEQADHIISTFQISRTQAYLLLTQNKRRIQNVMEKCSENLTEALKEAKALFVSHEAQETDRNTCLVCGEDDKEIQYKNIGCGHDLCSDCWATYINGKVTEGNVVIACPQYKCEYKAEPSFVSECVTPDVYLKYQEFLLRSILQQDPKIKWCPNPRCERLLEGIHVMDVTCECDETFCLKCGMVEGHYPTTCEEYDEWSKKSATDAKAEKWMSSFCKKCPKCGVQIEKNMGCNHMHCTRCNHHFCWICMKSSQDHYACNGYDEDGSTKPLQGKADLGKFLHHFDRFEAHEKSGKIARANLEKLKREIERSSIPGRPHEMDYLVDSSTELIKARTILKYSYAHAFFIENAQWKSIFQFLQGDLENATERMNFELESKSPKRQVLVDLTANVRRRMKNMITGSFEELHKKEDQSSNSRGSRA